jgi:hypothetical protein
MSVLLRGFRLSSTRPFCWCTCKSVGHVVDGVRRKSASHTRSARLSDKRNSIAEHKKTGAGLLSPRKENLAEGSYLVLVRFPPSSRYDDPNQPRAQEEQ